MHSWRTKSIEFILVTKISTISIIKTLSVLELWGEIHRDQVEAHYIQPEKWKSLSCVLLCNAMDYIVHGILQARILERVAFLFSRGSSQPKNQTYVSCIAGLPHCRWILYQLSHKGSPRILKWVAYPFSSGSSWSGIEPVSLALQFLCQLTYEGSPYIQPGCLEICREDMEDFETYVYYECDCDLESGSVTWGGFTHVKEMLTVQWPEYTLLHWFVK